MPAQSSLSSSAGPSPLYTKLLSLSQSHAEAKSFEEIFTIRSPDAIHAWGHNYLVSRNQGLQDRMDNDAFKSHLLTTGPYLDDEAGSAATHDILIDERKRKAVIHMSYFLVPKGSEEKVENELIWLLKFTDPDEKELKDPSDVDGILIKESVEYIDAAASSRLGTVIRKLNGGKLNKDVRGGITLQENC
jgi:hypothetical protein